MAEPKGSHSKSHYSQYQRKIPKKNATLTEARLIGRVAQNGLQD